MGEHGLAQPAPDLELHQSRQQPIAQDLGQPAAPEARVGDGAARLDDGGGQVDGPPVRRHLARRRHRDLADPLARLELGRDAVRVVHARHRVGPAVGAVQGPGEGGCVGRQQLAEGHVLRARGRVVGQDLEGLGAQHPMMGRQREAHLADVPGAVGAGLGSRDDTRVEQGEYPVRRSRHRLAEVVQGDDELGAAHLAVEPQGVVLLAPAESASRVGGELPDDQSGALPLAARHRHRRARAGGQDGGARLVGTGGHGEHVRTLAAATVGHRRERGSPSKRPRTGIQSPPHRLRDGFT